jgi:hypothetical protein
MPRTMCKGAAGVFALVAALAAHGAEADRAATLEVASWEGPPDVAAAAPEPAPRTKSPLLGTVALDAKALATKRGGTDVFNDMQLKGVVADNRAINVITGGNQISDGAFANTSGLPMVVQNTGNNVLIQNATIVNVQVK